MLDLLNLEEAAKELRVSIHTMRGWSQKGRFPKVKLGRRVLIKREDLEEFVRRGEVKAEVK